MNICEIFYSIQGEGQLMGLPTVFIRTSGCNLRCNFCDTTYAYETGTQMSVKQILQKVEQYPCHRICLTGGEPLLQTESFHLLQKFHKQRYALSIETNGSKDIHPLLLIPDVMISLDIKCPSSTMSEHMLMNNIFHLRSSDQIKCVVQTKKDYEFIKQIKQQYHPSCEIYVQPAWNQIDLETLAQWILDDGLDLRFGLQLHKYIFSEKKGC